MKNKIKLTCVNCGKTTDNAKGSFKHPYCKKCFRIVWNNSSEKYMIWLQATHG